MRTLLLLASILALTASHAVGHGGSFRGPNGGIPPGLRTPFDPEPPPPPPTPPGTPGETVTPGENGGTTTPEGSGSTTPGAAQPTPVPPRGTPRRGARTKTMTFDSWRFWWAYNNDDILNLKSHIHATGLTSASGAYFLTAQDRNNVREPARITRRAVITRIIPALRATLNRPREHEDVHGGALVALGKVGSIADAALFEAAAFNRLRAKTGERVKLGGQATESGVLALGMLPDLDATAKADVREICLKIIRDDSLRSRERAWAAVCLGLQKDEKAVEPLIGLLEAEYDGDAKRNVPAGILCALGLIGSEKPRELLEGMLLARKADVRVLAYAGYALGKIADPRSVPLLARIVKSRTHSRIVRRSAAIALGTCGARGDADVREAAVKALVRYLDKTGGDRTGENFATIALSRIGNDEAIRVLLKLVDRAGPLQKPYAALGLGTLVWYRQNERRPLDPDVVRRIREAVARGSEKHKDTEVKAAFMIARGLLKDRTAIEELVRIVSRRGDASLRGPCCVALGLMGRENVSQDVKDALRGALRERASRDLRRDAATALGLIRDAETVPLLLTELKRAKSFTVQGQIILAIGTIGDARAVDPLIEILEDGSHPDATRAMAAVGLGMIGDLLPLPRLGRLSKDYNYRASVRDLDELLYIL